MRPPAAMRFPYRLTAATGAITLIAALACVPGAPAAPPPPMIVQVHPVSGGISSYLDISARPGGGAWREHSSCETG